MSSNNRAQTDIDYSAVEVPSDKDPEEYHWTERRAAILNRILERGAPSLLPSQTQLADRYGVAQSTISKDLRRIRDDVESRLGRDAKVTTKSLFHRAIREKAEEEDFEAAFHLSMKWNRWLQDVGEQERVADKLDADVTTREAATETDEYVLLEDDEAVELEAADEAE